jgi:hypothetical protein
MTDDLKQGLFARVKAANARDPHHFAKQAATPEAIARHAHRSAAVEGREVSEERMRVVTASELEGCRRIAKTTVEPSAKALETGRKCLEMMKRSGLG